MPGERFPTNSSADYRMRSSRAGRSRAIKIHREATGMGLKESKDEVEAIEARLRQSHPEVCGSPAPMADPDA